MSNLPSIILVASLGAIGGVIGNIVYFNYRLKKEGNKEVLKMRLTNLLLPLYYILKNDELEVYLWIKGEADPYEYESDKPKRLLNPLVEIIKRNLYLADDELHEACISFIEWAYQSDVQERFQKVHYGILEEDIIFSKFRDVVYKKYDEARSAYIK
ncbi:MAG: hypothetical protein KGL95_04495 [Patescibacteria group bacterium]|nr:hypothetical protein [Patescibacteria group bacterium]